MANKFKTLLPAAGIILLVVLIAGYWLTNKPRADRKPSENFAPLVDLTSPEIKTHQTSIFAMGTVIASQNVNLTPRISGMVVDISPNFIEGGMLKKGEPLVQLDPTDYLLAIKQKENEVAKAQFNLKIEQGQQAIVKREYQLLGTNLNDQEQELVLRKPHLNAAKAALAAAEASLKQAHLDLERTKPVAPFNAIIVTRNANLGAWMPAFSTGTPLARLVGTDSFWINASIPVDKLSAISIPGINSDQGSLVKISYETGWGAGVYRTGKVKRLQAEIEPEGRMAKVIIEVEDPLAQKPVNKNAPPLMLGNYVRLEIVGHELKDVFILPEALLHEGKEIWLLNDQQQLEIRPINPTWTEPGFVYLSKDQLSESAQIISSDLSTPVVGMKLRAKPSAQPAKP